MGGLLGSLLQTKPRLTGVLFDRPDVVAAAKAYPQPPGVADRIAFVGGDFLAEVPVGAGVYLLKSVLHDWDDDKCRTILHNCRRAMGEDAKLLIVERLLPDRALDDPVAILVDMHMLAITGGRERSPGEFERLLSQSGFALSKVTVTDIGFSVVEAVPA